MTLDLMTPSLRRRDQSARHRRWRNRELIEIVAGKMVAEKVVRIDRAEAILKEIRD